MMTLQLALMAVPGIVLMIAFTLNRRQRVEARDRLAQRQGEQIAS